MSDKKAFPNDTFPRDESKGSGSTTAYSVEVRTSSHFPEKIGDIIVDDKWRPFRFQKSDFGVPNKVRCHHAEQAGLMSWATANAMRWWLHSATDLICLETRLIKHKVEYSYKIVAESAHNVIGGEDRSSIMPDWGAGKPKELST